MSKIFLVRHGYAHHNKAAEIEGNSAYFDPRWKDAQLLDPHKTGELAYKNLLEHGIDIRKPRKDVVVLVSPLTRTIQTAVHTTKDTHDLHVYDELTERQGHGHVCNLRKTATEIGKIYPHLKLNIKEHQVVPRVMETPEEIKARVLNVVRKHKDVPYIVVFTHCMVIHAFTGETVDNGEVRVIHV